MGSTCDVAVTFTKRYNNLCSYIVMYKQMRRNHIITRLLRKQTRTDAFDLRALPYASFYMKIWEVRSVFLSFYIEAVETPACSAYHFKGNEISYLLRGF